MKIEQIGQKLGLNSFHDVPKGNVSGFDYYVTLVNIDLLVKMNFIVFVFNKKLTKYEKTAISKAQGLPIMRIESIGLQENAVMLPLKYGFKRLEKHQKHLDKLAALFTRLELKNLSHCPFCGNEDNDTYGKLKGIPIAVHKACVDGYVEQVETHVETTAKTVKNLPKSILFAILGAIIGLIPTILTLSIFSTYFALLFALIPLCSFYGYKKGNGPRAAYVPVIITVISMIIAPTFIVLMYMMVADYEQVTLSTLLGDPEMMSSFQYDLGISVLFIAIGVLIAWKNIYKQTHAQVKKDLKELKNNN
ncbi:MAG: hypothetical protein Q7I99_07850 [Acholeplasmataceae bacterium]|nr:hypothetical protein [Acholeplasmataceae bacterium]